MCKHSFLFIVYSTCIILKNSTETFLISLLTLTFFFYWWLLLKHTWLTPKHTKMTYRFDTRIRPKIKYKMFPLTQLTLENSWWRNTWPNDFCFVDFMEAANLKILLAQQGFLLFYDTEKHLMGNKWSSEVFKQPIWSVEVNSLCLCIQGRTKFESISTFNFQWPRGRQLPQLKNNIESKMFCIYEKTIFILLIKRKQTQTPRT